MAFSMVTLALNHQDLCWMHVSCQFFHLWVRELDPHKEPPEEARVIPERASNGQDTCLILLL